MLPTGSEPVLEPEPAVLSTTEAGPAGGIGRSSSSSVCMRRGAGTSADSTLWMKPIDERGAVELSIGAMRTESSKSGSKYSRRLRQRCERGDTLLQIGGSEAVQAAASRAALGCIPATRRLQQRCLGAP